MDCKRFKVVIVHILYLTESPFYDIISIYQMKGDFSMELLKSIVVDFVLFSGIEGFIFCLFFEKIGGCRKFKWYEWLILSFGNCVISQMLPPTIYQVVCIIWMSIILNFIKHIKLKKSIVQSILSVLSFFLVEVFN